MAPGDEATQQEREAQRGEQQREVDPEEPQDKCEDPERSLVEAIATGLTVSGGGDLEGAAVVTVASDRRNDRGWPAQIVAAQITGAGLDGAVGAWATAETETDGPIFAVDGIAKEFSDWGSAAQPGSQMAEVRDTIANYPEVDAAKDCVE